MAKDNWERLKAKWIKLGCLVRQKHWTAVQRTTRDKVSEIVMLQMPTRKNTKPTETVPSEPGKTVLRAEAMTVSNRYDANSKLWLVRHGRTPLTRQNTPAAQTKNTNGRTRVGIPIISPLAPAAPGFRRN